MTLGCSVPAGAETDAEDSPVAHQRLAGPTQALPMDRPTIGLNPDWGVKALEQFATTTGVSPGAAVSFIDMPFSSTDARNVLGAAEQVAGMGGVLMLTLEPHKGLGAVTEESIAELTDLLGEVNASEVPVLLRFAHEMNGSWYPWAWQPQAYVQAFRQVAAAVREQTTATEMIWAPNYGGGYPFVGGQYAPDPGTEAFELLDTDADGELTQMNDPYAPFYPGDDVVDWVGMSLHHWGDSYPWGSNDLPEPAKFAEQLRGTYSGLAGDESMLPDFYELYAANRDKPLAIPETAAFVTADADPELSLQIKRRWWQQIFCSRAVSVNSAVLVAQVGLRRLSQLLRRCLVFPRKFLRWVAHRWTRSPTGAEQDPAQRALPAEVFADARDAGPLDHVLPHVTGEPDTQIVPDSIVAIITVRDGGSVRPTTHARTALPGESTNLSSIPIYGSPRSRYQPSIPGWTLCEVLGIAIDRR
nr:glycosyl hydrolase [Nesterenkonia sp. AY15]